MKNLDKEIEKTLEELHCPNIAVIGRTGAGKSTVINEVFGKNFARTGAGFPVSQSFQRYPHPDETDSKVPVVI